MNKRLRKALKDVTNNWARYNGLDILKAKSNLIKNLDNQNTCSKLKYNILKDQHYYNYF